MLREAKNSVRIEGILSEINLEYGSFTKKDGTTVKSIRGNVKIQVKQVVNGEEIVLEIPVHMFAPETKNDGGKNPAFESIERVMNSYVSIAAAGSAAEADAVRITSGKISMNEYYTPDGRLVSFPRITASFLSKIKKDEMKPAATFEVELMVAKKGYVTDKDGVETDKYQITGIVPQYGGKVDVIPFFTSKESVTSAIEQYWTENDTVAAQGRLNFTSTTETVVTEVDFGDPIETTRTISVSELLITGGSSTALDGEFAYDIGEIQQALAARKATLEEKKNNAGKTAPKAVPEKGSIDLGF